MSEKDIDNNKQSSVVTPKPKVVKKNDDLFFPEKPTLQSSSYREEKVEFQPEKRDISSSSTSVTTYEDEGSALVGFILVLLLNWIGLIIAIFTKQRKTKKAAIVTMIVFIAIGFVAFIIIGICFLLGIIGLNDLGIS